MHTYLSEAGIDTRSLDLMGREAGKARFTYECWGLCGLKPMCHMFFKSICEVWP